MTETEPVVRLAVEGPVATVTLNRPASRNAISGELLARLGEAMAVIDADDEIRAAILTGAGPAFCAGVDLKELGQQTSVLRAAASGGTASDRAVFADTHARVGVLPGWGLSVLLPLAVGRSRARQMSFTGDFLPADQALAAGLVSEVVPHADLLTRAREIATAIAGNDARAVQALLASYRQTEAEVVGGGPRSPNAAARRLPAASLDTRCPQTRIQP